MVESRLQWGKVESASSQELEIDIVFGMKELFVMQIQFYTNEFPMGKYMYV